MSDQELEELLDGVWRRRRSELLERVEELQHDLQLARRGDLAAWALLGTRAHRFTGAVGTLGFSGPAVVSGRVEAAVAANPTPSPALLDALEADVTALDAELRAAHSRPRQDLRPR